MIVALSGLIGSGKDTVANYLVQNYGFLKLSFGSTVKDTVSSLFKWPRNLLEGDTEESRLFREEVDSFWTKKFNSIVTPRWAMQYVGTDLVRNQLHQNMWVDCIEREITLNKVRDIVISDCRFPNEIDMLSSVGAKLAVVLGKNEPAWITEVVNTGKTNKAHESEWAWLNKLDHYPYRIRNQAGFDELHQNIEGFLDDAYGKSKGS